MKKLYFSLITAAFSSALLAQHQITSALLPALGDVEFYYVADSVGVQPSYNQSALSIGTLQGKRSYVTVPSAFTADFSGSSYAQEDTTDYAFYTVGANSVTFDGAEITFSSPFGPINGRMVFSTDKATIYNALPFGMGNSVVNDAVAGTVSSSAGSGTLTGTTNTTVMSTGNLQLPGGTYNNAILVQVDTKLDLVVNVTGIGSLPIDVDQLSYMYFASNSKFPLLEIRYTHIYSSAGGTDTKAVFVSNTFVGMKENGNNAVSFNLFPSPASNTLNLNLNIASKTSFDVEIFNQLGQVVYAEKMENVNAGKINKKIDVSSLSSGIYFLRTKNESINTVKKFIIE